MGDPLVSLLHFQALKNGPVRDSNPRAQINSLNREKLASTARPSGKYFSMILVAIRNKCGGGKKKIKEIPVLKQLKLPLSQESEE